MAFLDLSFHLDLPPEQKNDQKDNKNIGRDFEYYRDKIVTVAGIIITFSTAAFAFILKNGDSSLMQDTIEGNVFAKVVLYISFVLLFFSVIGSLLSIYFIIEGYKQQGRSRANQVSKPHNPIFTNADKLIVWVLLFFGIATFLLFLILSIQYFVT